MGLASLIMSYTKKQVEYLKCNISILVLPKMDGSDWQIFFLLSRRPFCQIYIVKNYTVAILTNFGLICQLKYRFLEENLHKVLFLSVVEVFRYSFRFFIGF